MFERDLKLFQVLFSGSDHFSRVALQTPDERTCNLLVTVNEHGATDKKVLLAAFLNVNKIIKKKGTAWSITFIDGHKSCIFIKI